MDHSICRFTTAGNAPDVIHIIHFVYETERGNRIQKCLETSYKLGLVVSGNAVMTCYEKKETLQRGDLFFACPADPYILETDSNFTFLYISFLGLRANMLLDQLKIKADNFVFRGFEALIPVWMDAICSAKNMPELAAEGMLLYTLMKLGNLHSVETDRETDITARTMLRVKKMIDDDFVSPELSVAVLAQQIGYHEKYISLNFKKYFKMGIKDYIIQLRINRACLLMEQGYTCIKDIAARCGYADSMYFSKVFRKKMGMPPREYLQVKKSDCQ